MTDKDCNTKYFRTIANMSKKHRLITRIKIGGNLIWGKREVKAKIREHFLDHFEQEQISFISLPMGSFKQISPDLAFELEAIPSGHKIMEAIRSCDPYKALGYVWFNFKFILKMWDILGKEVINFVRDFFVTGYFPTSINVTWSPSFLMWNSPLQLMSINM